MNLFGEVEMAKKPNIDEVDKIALIFAQSLISTSDGVRSNRELFEKATEMAIEWLDTAELRQIKIAQYYPNWIDLSQKTSAKELQLDIGRNYWFFAQCTNSSNPNPHQVLRGTVLEIRDNGVDVPIVHLIKTQGTDRYIGLYYLTEQDGAMFSESFKPAPPELD